MEDTLFTHYMNCYTTTLMGTPLVYWYKHGMHGDYVIITPLHDAEEDSTEVESSNR